MESAGSFALRKTVFVVADGVERVYVFVLQVIPKTDRSRWSHKTRHRHIPKMKTTRKCPAKGRPRLDAEKRKSILITVKFDVEQYGEIMGKAVTAGLNKSEYLRHAALRCTVVPRLSAKDLQAIRDLQGIKNNLNSAVKFINYFMKMNGKADGQQLIDSVGMALKCVRFITDLIEEYRNGGG